MKGKSAPIFAVFLACSVGYLKDASPKGRILPMPPTWDQVSNKAAPETALCFGKKIPPRLWNKRSLTLVPGISDRLALRILRFAKRNQGELDPCHLEKVHGIGPKLADRVRSVLLGDPDCSLDPQKDY